MRFSEADSRMLARCIRELEARTAAEVALVVRKVSGNYRDIDYLFGGFSALATLGVMLYSPWPLHALSVPLPLVIVFFASAFFCRRSGMRRYLTRARRRELQVRRAAEACFYEKGMGRTRNRTGILLYLSMMEKTGLILPDQGAASRLDPVRLREFASVLGAVARGAPRRRAEHLGGFIRSFGVFLGRGMPVEAGSAPHELDDRPELDSDEDE